MKARINTIGTYLPEKVLKNSDLEQMVDTSDEWITTRTGMKERRIANKEHSSSDLGLFAAQKALENAKIDPKTLDLVLVATSTPDHLMPSTAAIIQAKIGASKAAAFDMQAACTGFLYGLSMAKAYIESGMYRSILLIAVDKMSSIIDYSDRETCVLFGDGAAAAVISGRGAGLLIDSICLGSDGSLSDLIIVPGGGSRMPANEETVKNGKHYFKMAGKEVFKHAVRRMSSSANECLELAGLKEQDIAWLIPHQANERIMDAIAKNLAISSEKVGKTVHKYGNTSGSSVGITLHEVLEEKEIQAGNHLLLVAFGSGLTWGASILTKTGGEG